MLSQGEEGSEGNFSPPTGGQSERPIMPLFSSLDLTPSITASFDARGYTAATLRLSFRAITVV
jgi:hypothetical protein